MYVLCHIQDQYTTYVLYMVVHVRIHLPLKKVLGSREIFLTNTTPFFSK